MRGEVRILDRTGHTALAFDTETKNTNLANGPLDAEYVKAEFDRLVSQGHLAWAEQTNPDTGKSENVQLRMGEFDPNVHEKVTVSPQFVGG